MKKVLFIGFLAVSFIMLATLNIVGAQEAATVPAINPEEWNGEAPDNVGPLVFYTIFPCRSEDTRFNYGINCRPCGSGTTWNHNIQYNCPAVPSYANAVAINLTATNIYGGGWLTAWPQGTPKPATSSLNYGRVSGLPAIANGLIIPVTAGATYEMSIYVRTACDWIIDVMGYFD